MKKLLTFVLCLLALNSVFGQSTANYAFTTATGTTLADMSTGTTQLIAGPSDDAASSLTNIGFTFYFMGAPYTQFSVNSNGQIRLGSTIIAGTNVSSVAVSSPFIIAISGDNYTLSTGKVHYKVTGTSPNQILVVEWKDLRIPYSTSGIGSMVQTWLYETTGKIEFRYGAVSNNASTTTTRATFISSSNTANTVKYIGTDMISAVDGSSASTYTMTDPNTALLNTRIYTFTPAAVIPADPTTLTFTAVTTTTITPNWVDNSTDETFFIITRATDAAFTQNVVVSTVNSTTSATTGNAYSSAQTGLLPGTLYYYMIQAATEGFAPSAGLTGSQATNAPDPLHGIYTINNLLPTTTPMVHTGVGNFHSFTDAINYMNGDGISAAVTLNVSAAQTFAEDCPAITVTGTATNTITFQKSGAGVNPVITPTGTAGTSDAGIIISGGDYITFDGIDITIATGSAVEYGYMIRNATVTNGAKYNTVKNSKIILNRTNTASKGIYQYRAATASDTNGANSHNTYQNNTIENSYMGIYVYGSSAYPDLGCYINYNMVGAATANDIGAGSIASNGIRASYQSGIMIAANTVRNVSTTAASLYGIYLESGQGTNNIFNNRVYTIGTTSTSTSYVVYGIRADINATYTVNVFNNMVSDLNHGITTASATQVIRAMAVGISGTGTGNFIYNSVKVSEDAFPTSTAMYIGGGTVNLYDNIFVNTSTAGATSKRYCIYRSGGTMLSDYNDLYIDAVGTNNFTGYFAADVATLAAWQTASGSQDMHSISVNPTFTSATDLHTTTSALNGVGLPIAGITFDIDMEPRDINTPDIGADENLAPPAYTCTPPAPGNTLSTANNLCLGQSIVLSLQNATSGTGVIYQWQSSANGVTYSNITGAINSTYMVTPTANIFYQCIVTCLNGPVSATSTPIQITFANSILTTVPASRCGTGTVSLVATGTPGATISWYDAVTDTLMGTGSPWITPVISATTTFNVAAEIPALGSVIGAGALTSTSYQGPFYHLYGGVKSQYLITASELTAAGFAAGNIDNLGINVVAAGIPYTEFNLNMGSTMDAALTTTFVTGLANVYYDPALTLTTGFYNFTLANAYNWDGTSNVVIEFCWSNNNGGGTSATVKADATSFVAGSYQRADNTAPAVLCATTTTYGTVSYRPQFFLNYTPMCAGPRVPVVASVSTSPALTLTASQTVCNNSVATIAVTSTLGDYDSYVWTPETDLYTDIAGTIPYISGASATIVYVKSTTAAVATYTCTANNSVSSCANVATSTVTILPASPVATAASVALCLSGATTISISPVTGYGDATFQWQISTDNVTFTDISGATSAAYTTPTITITTYYKLLVKLGASVCTESNVVTVIVNNPQIVSTTPASRCGTGTVILGATGSAGTTLNWYDVATGGLSLGTGASFTTPSISLTTNYYVGAENSAAANIAVGAGANTSSYSYVSPFYHSYGGLKSQYLIRASELAAAGLSAGNLTALSFNIAYAGIAYNDFNLSIGATSLTSLTTALQTGLTNVYSAPSVTPTVGIYTITFAIPYLWNGTSNIIVETCWSNNNPGGTSADVMYDNTAFVSTSYNRLDNTPAATLCATTTAYSTMSQRPQIIFAGQGVCSSVRTLVVATVSTPPAITVTATPDTICASQTTTLVASSSNAGYTYSWTPATTPATGATVSGSPVLTTIYSVTATDNSGGAYDGCVAIATANVHVNPIPATVIVTPATDSLCIGDAAILLTATGGSAGVIATFGTATTTNTTTGYPAPYTNYYGGAKHQMMIRASEMAAAGMVAGPINSISFTVAAVGTSFTGVLDSFQISMKNTTANVLSISAFETGLNLVYGPLSQVIPTTGLPASVMHTITPFIWDGTSNLVIETSFSNGNVGTTADNVQMTYSNPGFESTTWYMDDGVTAAEILASTIPYASSSIARPNMVLDNVSIAVITWSPVTDLYTDAAATIPYTGTATGSVYAKPATAGIITYTATATGSNLCTNSDAAVVTVNLCSGVEENKNDITISIVPNPSNGLFYLNVEGINETVTMNIYSISGQLVYTEQVGNTGLVNKPVDLGSYPKGMYFLRLINKNITHTEKIIIE